MFSERIIVCIRGICVATIVVLLFPALSLGQPTKQTRTRQKVAAPTPTTPKAMLDLAMYYYNSDDLSGKAEQSFKKLLTKNYENTPEYETAQYYLASYYHRKFYLLQAKFPEREPDWNGLKQSAIPEYIKYTSRFDKRGKPTWLSDAFFNLALVYLRIGDLESAKRELRRITEASIKDPKIYIYQVVWSPQSQTVVDAHLPATRLADYTLSLVQGRDYWFEKAVLQLQKWGQAQR